MAERRRKTLIMVLAALFLALASFFALNFSVAKADSVSYADKSNLNFYSAGIKYRNQEEVFARTFVTNLTNRQNELMNKGVGVINYKLAFIRSEDSNLLNMAKQSRDLYWQGIASNAITDGFNPFLSSLNNAQVVYKTAEDNNDPETEGTGTEGGTTTTNWSSYSAEFVETKETIYTNYYYICVLIENYDYPEMSSYKDRSNIVAISNTSYEMNSSDIISKTLEDATQKTFSKSQALAYHKTCGVYFEENTEVLFNYKKLNNSTSIIEDVTESFTVESFYRTSPKIIFDYAEKQVVGLETGSLLENKDLSYFNVIDNDAVYENGYENITQEKILYRATGFNYEIDNENNKFIITVEYTELDISEYSIKFYDNNPDDGVSGAFNSYSTDIKDDGKELTCIWDIERIKTLTINARNWCFDKAEFYVILKDSSFVINGEVQNDGSKLYKTSEGIKFYVYQTTVKLICPTDKVDKLFKTVEIEAMVDLQPDKYVKLEFNYVELSIEDGDIKEQSIKVKVDGAFSYMQSKNYFSSLDNMNIFLESQGYESDLINNSVMLSEIAGADYFCRPVSIRYENTGRIDPESLFPIYAAYVMYDYSALFKITCTFPDQLNDTVIFKAINGLNYTADYFVDVFDVSSDYRVGSFSYNKDHLKVTDEENALDCKFEIVTSIREKTIINVVVNYTDEWKLQITYFQQYVNEDGVETPFALLTTSTYSVKVKEYDNIYALTNSDLEEILPKGSVEFCGVRVAADGIHVRFDGSTTYKITLDYTFRTVREIDSKGYYNELQVPLTPYSYWCEYFGEDWSIMFLNNPTKGAKAYFKYSDSVPKSRLYGFFAVAAFEEKHSSIDSWFATQTESDDVKVLYKGKDVRGDAFYRFWQNHDVPILGSIMSWFGELFNSNNKLVYSYFFYLDITDNFTESFISNSGAKDFYDVDGAFENKFGCSCTEGCGNLLQALFYIAIAIFAIIVLAIIIKVIRWARK